MWIVIWSIAGVAAVSTIMRQLAGKQIITANSLSLSRGVEFRCSGGGAGYGAIAEAKMLLPTSSAA